MCVMCAMYCECWMCCVLCLRACTGLCLCICVYVFVCVRVGVCASDVTVSLGGCTRACHMFVMRVCVVIMALMMHVCVTSVCLWVLLSLVAKLSCLRVSVDV